MGLSTAVAACVMTVATHYGVAPERLARTLAPVPAVANAQPSVGAAHIPTPWLALLTQYGFSEQAIADNPCTSVAAAGWILKYTAQVQRILHAQQHLKLPARAQVWQPYIRAYAARAGVDPSLVNAVILQESGFNPTIVSSANAYGLMQLTPDTAKTLGVNRYLPLENLWGGIWYLSDLLRAYRGNLALALAAYNAGPGAVSRYKGIPPYRQTLDYVPAVLTKYQSLLQVAEN